MVCFGDKGAASYRAGMGHTVRITLKSISNRRGLTGSISYFEVLFRCAFDHIKLTVESLCSIIKVEMDPGKKQKRGKGLFPCGCLCSTSVARKRFLAAALLARLVRISDRQEQGDAS